MNPKSRRHRWGPKTQFPLAHKSERECLNGCGIVKVSKRGNDGPRDLYWTEFFRGLDKIAGAGEPTPVCEPVKVDA